MAVLCSLTSALVCQKYPEGRERITLVRRALEIVLFSISRMRIERTNIPVRRNSLHVLKVSLGNAAQYNFLGEDVKTLIGLILVVLTPFTIVAQDNPTKAQDQLELEKKIKENPDDPAMFNKYMSQTLSGVVPMISSNPDKAETELKKLDAFLTVLEPETPTGKQLLARGKSVSKSLQGRIKLTRTTLEEIKEKLSSDPDNEEWLNMFVAKTTNSAATFARSEPEKAEGIIAEAKTILGGIKEKTENEETKKAIDTMMTRSFSRLESTIAAGKKLKPLIGQDAAEMEVGTWANGEPLTSEELKGKVVLLDFWAVWCGPCIATFPHLKEWQEKYSDKGLVIVGVTRFYNYQWNEETGKAKRAKEKVSPEDETKMLEKFAESYELKHRFAVQDGNDLSKFYGVTGIPHAVVIDKEGKIRMIRVGSGEKKASDIENLLEELLN